MKLLELSTLSNEFEQDLHHLMIKCGGYEPYIDCKSDSDIDQTINNSVHYIATVDENNSELIGFLSWLITDTTAEITAMVSPDYRKRGLFTQMLERAVSFLKEQNVYNIICVLPDELTSSSLNHGLLYKEELMKLDMNILRNISNSMDLINDTKYDYYLSDDEQEYLMYEDNGEEPIAVLCLDYQESFTNIYGVYVDEDLRGQGIGYLLMKHMLNDYMEICDLPLVLQVSSLNTAAVTLYKKCGFTEASHISYYSLI